MGRYAFFIVVGLYSVSALAVGDNTHTQGVRFAGFGFDDQEPLLPSQWVPWFENHSNQWPPQDKTYDSIGGGTNQIRVEATCENDPIADPLFALCSGKVYKLVSGNPVQDTTACDPPPVRRSGRRAGASPGPKAMQLLAIRGKWNPTPGVFEQKDEFVTFACVPKIEPRPRWLHEIVPFTGDPSDMRATNLDTSEGLGVLAKCYLWGFAQPKETVASRIETYQACLRAARADYCGDGISQTERGTIIQVYEPNETKIGLPVRVNLDKQYCSRRKDPKSSESIKQRKDLELQPCFEALWDAKGATCVNHARFLEMPVKGCKNNFKYEFATEIRGNEVFFIPAPSPDKAVLNCRINDYQSLAQEARVKNRSGLNSLKNAARDCKNDIPCP